MEVPEPLAVWLLAVGVVSRDAVRAGRGSSWVLDDGTTNSFLNGLVRGARSAGSTEHSEKTTKMLVDSDLLPYSRHPVTQAFAELLTALSSQREIPEPPLKGIKPGDTPIARLGNWSILTPLLSSFGLDVDADTKSLIVVGGANEAPGVAVLFPACGNI